jgi:CRP/FNR family transcriptional regulator, cyclic AMP receptor protein
MGVVQSTGRSATVTTLKRTTLAWMPRDDFQECLRAIPAMSVNLTIILAQRLRLANAQILSFATQDVHGRIARMRLAFGEEHGKRASSGDIHIPLRLTQSDLGSIVGASRVRVNQVMNSYKDAGIVSTNARNQITVHNADVLAQRCE